MSERYVTLLGAEQVQSAAGTMSRAADTMRSAAGSIDEALRQHAQRMDDWLQQFAQQVDRLEAAAATVPVGPSPAPLEYTIAIPRPGGT